MLKSGSKFTVYDAMEAAGIFSSNPANAAAVSEDGQSLYSGPVKFPMTLYHPRGEEYVLSPGTRERTAWGTVEVYNEQYALKTKDVGSEEELSEALAEGWHKHPSQAIRVANETWRKEAGLAPLPVPPQSAASRITDLEEENRRLAALIEEAKAAKREDEEALEGLPFAPSKVAGAAAKHGLV